MKPNWIFTRDHEDAERIASCVFAAHALWSLLLWWAGDMPPTHAYYEAGWLEPRFYGPPTAIGAVAPW